MKFKADYDQDTRSTYHLNPFVGQDGVIFYHEGSQGRVYFHLEQ